MILQYARSCLKRTPGLSHRVTVVGILAISVLALLFLVRFWIVERLRRNDRDNFSLSSDFVVPGYGNLLFQYASLYGIAKQTERVPVIPNTLALLRYFPLLANVSTSPRPGRFWGKLVERQACAYDRVIVSAASTSNDALELVGYFQSWLYFRNHENEIRQQFQFSANVSAIVRSTKKQSGLLDADALGAPFVTVGVHVRRGDMLKNYSRDFGYTVADRSYLERAMRFFDEKYPSVRYVVTSNDIEWCKEQVPSDGRLVRILSYEDAMMDMALLASCDHVIMTVGTFGWWAGWLSGGHVVYYKNFPRPGSKLEKAFSLTKTDHFPPRWIGL